MYIVAQFSHAWKIGKIMEFFCFPAMAKPLRGGGT